MACKKNSRQCVTLKCQILVGVVGIVGVVYTQTNKVATFIYLDI